MNRKLSFLSFCFASILAGLLMPSTIMAQATFQGLEFLPDGYSSQALDVSGNGNTVVGFDTVGSYYLPFKWTLDGGTQPFEYESYFQGGSANAISPNGEIIIGVLRDYYGYAFRLTNDGTYTFLGDLPGGYDRATPYDVSADGNVVVGDSSTSNGTGAFIWTPSSGINSLGDLGSGYYSSARGVSDDGSVIVGTSYSPEGYQAFLWTEANGMEGLGYLSENGNASYARGISSNGEKVVGYSYDGVNGSNRFEAFLWTANAGMQGLGFLQGGTYSNATAISGDGSTVVGWADSNSSEFIFIWDQQHGMRNLLDVLTIDSGLGAELQGWTLYGANSISNNGRVIVGYGRNPDGLTQAWRIDLGPSNTGPTISCPEMMSAECTGEGANVVVDVEVFDADGDELDITWSITLPDGSTDTVTDTVLFGAEPTATLVQLDYQFPHGASTVTVCVDDGISEIECCNPIVITVEDTLAPVILSIRDAIELPTDPGECEATIDLNDEPYAPVFSDICDPTITAINDAPATFPLGETLVTWTVTDDSGNELVAYQTVVVTDQEAPAGTAPTDILIGHDYGQSSATNVDLGMPDVQDNCEMGDIINDAPAVFVLGETEVKWYVSDAAGNTIILVQKVTVTNEAPVADAAMEQLTEIGSEAILRLDANGTSDADHPFEDLTFDWVIENLDTGEFTYLNGPLVDAFLGYGNYEVTLLTVDPAGDTGQVVKEVSLNPADLSSFNMECVKVLWLGNYSRAIITGEIGLPAGVDYGELFPMAMVNARLAGQDIAAMEPVIANTYGYNGQYWRFHDHQQTNGIHKFAIHWRGARYNFRDFGFPVRIKSDAISSSETVLTIRLTKRRIHEAFSIDFDGLATIDFDADGNVVDSTVEFDEERPGKVVSVTLPFPLLDTSTINFSGGLERQLAVGNDLQESVGRFLMDIRFDSSAFPDGKNTEPRTLDLDIFVGDELYPGSSSLDETDLQKRWFAWYNR